jgi:dTMP kinase
MNDYDGKLVAIEGLDGAGGTTLIDKLKEEYSDNDDFVFTKEPSDLYYGKRVRERLSMENDASPADFFAFLADRYQHCDEVIEPALEDGKTVITDRYALSTYAYQSKVLDEELGIIDPTKYIDEMTYHFTIEPDVYLYLSVDVATSIERSQGDEKYEMPEKLKEAKRIYDYKYEEKENVIRIPGTWDEEAVFEEAKIWIEGQL